MYQTIDELTKKIYPTYMPLIDEKGNMHLKYVNNINGRIKEEVMREINGKA